MQQQCMFQYDHFHFSFHHILSAFVTVAVIRCVNDYHFFKLCVLDESELFIGNSFPMHDTLVRKYKTVVSSIIHPCGTYFSRSTSTRIEIYGYK